MQRSPHDESGFALIAVIVLMALLLSLGAVGARTAQVELRIAGNDLRSRQALETAEAGIDHAMALLRLESAGVNAGSNGFGDELSAGGTGGGLAALGSVRTLDDGKTYRCNKLSEQSGDDGYCVRIADNEDETTGVADPATDLDGTIFLISRGTVGKAERVVEVRVVRDAVYDCVLCGNFDFPLLTPDVALLGGFTTDSFDSGTGPYDPLSTGNEGHIRSNGSVTMSGAPLFPVDIAGDVTATGSVQTLLPPVTVSGTTTQFALATAFAAVPPCGPPYPANDGLTGGLYDRATGVLSTVGPADIIQLQGGTPEDPAEYCFSSILMNGASELHVAGPAHIRLTQTSTILGVLNVTGVPSDVRISSSLVQPLPFVPVNPGLNIGANGGQLSAVVEAPNAQVSFAGPVTDIFGQIIAAIPPTAGVTAAMHYDEALNAPRIYRRGWRELRDHPPS